MKVNILMATYNGEKFLAQQIESIQKQTFKEWNLLIRDDGSSDKTCDIIRNFTAKDSRIRFINENEHHNLGVIKSFFTLVNYEVADFYFFSDQDDVWLPEKLSVSLEAAKHKASDVPLLVYTDLKVVNQELNILQDSMIRAQSHHANTTLLPELTENTVTGGTMMINHALAEKWFTPNDILMHDWFLALLAASLGEIIYLDLPTQLYRQHDNNVLGARTMDKRFKILREGPKSIFTRYWKLIHDSQKQASLIVDKYGDIMTANDLELIKCFIKIDKQPFMTRLRWLWKYGYSKNQFKHQVVFKWLIATNYYNKR
ncbi:TPA: glycosyltransferase family 2 protein [Streptococcus agalactiae]|uniref:Glycosyl transferase, group 2 family protein n=11 Tax=Streptococcus agalactiae TaxID=1311 RepID=Q8DYQ2_STRA5|nr:MULTISPECIES: glycosyltransferase family 2 protein [Streptococcus]EPX01916.1 glycosyl transferase family 2 [Streptococcus agalactiae MRI Z1-049]EPX10970.1 glycosyl transferase family 2 [Streptococcus agalactiae LDS 610]MBR3055624.1 glycosyltransferase family 2 protein [Streptococcus sp.]MBW1568536.1 glycosyltransferase family 2 protein [Streptococcus sp. SPC0]MEE3706045.1 glycosyltransferase family 2 protein [Streptococcus sp. R3]MEE3844274.1 glycosyltransferase family 2 protein [Streptoco